MTTNNLYDKISALSSEEIKQTLYKEYCQMARHYHQLIWTNIGIALPAAILGIWGLRELEPLPYTLIGIGFIVFIILANLMAEGHRQQWQDAINVANMVEASWGLRETAKSGPLIHSEKKSGYVKRIRTLFVFICILMWLFAIIIKWDCFK